MLNFSRGLVKATEFWKEDIVRRWDSTPAVNPGSVYGP